MPALASRSRGPRAQVLITGFPRQPIANAAARALMNTVGGGETPATLNVLQGDPVFFSLECEGNAGAGGGPNLYCTLEGIGSATGPYATASSSTGECTTGSMRAPLTETIGFYTQNGDSIAHRMSGVVWTFRSRR